MTRKRYVKLIRAKMAGRKGVDFRKFENSQRNLIVNDKFWSSYEKLITLVFNAIDACESAEVNK